MKTHYRYLATAAAIGLTACASAVQKVDYPAGTDPQAKVSEVRSRMNDDQTKQFDKLSPDHFEQASHAISDAQHKLDKGDSSANVLSQAGIAAANLDIVEKNANQYSGQMTQVMNARKAALDAHADKTMSDDMVSADKDFAGFGKDIEGGNFHPDGKDVSKLEATYSDIELKSVKKSALGQEKDMLDRANNRDAKSKAPKTLAEAQMKYDTALRAIEANRRQPSTYQPAVNDSLTSATKLDQVMTTIETTKATEAAAVQIYDQKQQIAQTQKSLNQANEQTQAAQTQAASEAQTVATLQGQNDQYADKAKLNEKIAAVKSEFNPDEAEVLRDGNKIILRLKTMKFSTARFELTQSSLDTLQKVKDMIAAVPVAKVVVEGHTDSVGGEAKNMTLSQKRADTVKKYLVAENAVPADKVEAEGFGYQHPLTSNKTAHGRAINRRVDVVIDPSTQL